MFQLTTLALVIVEAILLTANGYRGSGIEFLIEVARYREDFLECMDDDFNTGGAIGVLYELLRELNRFADARRLEESDRTPADLNDFRLGIKVLRELSEILDRLREREAHG